MLKYFISDITKHTLNFLDKDSSFSLVNTSTTMRKHARLLHSKYSFYHDDVKDNEEMKKTMKYLTCSCAQHLKHYNGLHGITLRLGLGKSRELLKIDLPNDLIFFEIDGYYFNQELDFLPPHLQSLTINSNSFNKQINTLPKNLIHLEINGRKFNQNLDELSDTLETLKIINSDKLKCKFDGFVDQLPKSLTSLTIEHHNFNRTIDNLPQTLKFLCIEGDDFNNNIKNLPHSLETLMIMSYNFNKSINHLPDNLSELVINSTKFDQTVEKLPSKLQILLIGNRNLKISSGAMPKTLHKLEIDSVTFNLFDDFPDKLQILKLWVRASDLHLDKLPPSLLSFELMFDGNDPLDNLPKTLVSLTLSNCNSFNQPLCNLPSSLKELTISRCSNFNQPIVFPHSGQIYIAYCPLYKQQIPLKDLMHINSLTINGVTLTN